MLHGAPPQPLGLVIHFNKTKPVGAKALSGTAVHLSVGWATPWRIAQ